MRKILLISMILASVEAVNGQAGVSVVTDPGSYGYMAENGAIAAEQLTTLERQMTLLEQAKDAIEKINENVQTLSMLTDILRNQAQIVKQIRASYSSLENSKVFTPGELGRVLSAYNDILRLVNEEITLATKIMESGLFKMNDNERIEWLSKTKKSSDQSLGEVNTINSSMERQKQKKQLLKIMSR